MTGEAVASPSSRDSSPSSAAVADPAETEPSGRDAWPWLLGGLLGVAASSSCYARYDPTDAPLVGVKIHAPSLASVAAWRG